ncbi:hypothetical protein ACJMK2_029852 [Sinanodonta woodiana]|uniref:Uncharacterized protein n=1 Tax=Sinanodonta woodiana TaxID=1069815 RepID=A0ABD3XDE5_SINWO
MSSARRLLEYWGNRIVGVFTPKPEQIMVKSRPAVSEREEIYSPDEEFYDTSMEVVDDGVQTPARTKYLDTPTSKQFVTRSRLHVDSQPYNIKVELPQKYNAANHDDEIPLRVSDSDFKIRKYEMYSPTEYTNGIHASNPPESVETFTSTNCETFVGTPTSGSSIRKSVEQKCIHKNTIKSDELYHQDTHQGNKHGYCVDRFAEKQNVHNPSRGNTVSLSVMETPLPLPTREKLESQFLQAAGDDNVLCNNSRCSNGCCTNESARSTSTCSWTVDSGHVTSEAEESPVARNSVPNSRSSGRCINSLIHKSNCIAYDSSSGGDFNHKEPNKANEFGHNKYSEDDAMASAIEYEAFEGTWPSLQKPVNKEIPVRALRSKQDLPQTNTETGNQKESKDSDTQSNIDNLTRAVKSLQESVDTVAKLSTENTRQINMVIGNMQKKDSNTTYRVKHQATRANLIECYTCHGLGHMSRDCPAKKNPNRPNIVGTVSQQSEETAVEKEQNTANGVYGSSGNAESESNWLGSWSVEQLREFQQNDPCIGLVLKLKEEGAEKPLPSQLVGERQEAKSLMRQWTSLEVQDGLLYKRWETTHNHLKPYQSDKIPDCWNLTLNAHKNSSDNIDETGSDYTEAPDTSAESDIHDIHFGMNFCQRNVPLETDHIDLHVDEEELTDFLVQEGIQEEERGFRIPVTRDGISCPIEGCHRDVRKYLRHWEEIHRAMFTFRLCPICRQTFKRPSDLRRHLRRIHNLDQDMTEKLVAKARTETRPNKRYIDPGSFLPPRVKDKPSGGIASSLSSTLSSSTNIHVPQSSFSRGGPASCNNTCSTTLLSDSIPSLSCEGSATSCLSSTLSSISDIPVPPLPSVRVNTALFSNQTIPSAPERCIITAEGPYSRPLDLPQYRQQQTSFTNISVGLRLVRITDALQTAITRLATIEGENRVAKERDARRLLEQDNRRLRAALSQKDSHDYCRLNVYVPRDEVVEFEERPDGTLRAVKRLKTGALPFTGQPPRYPAKPYTVVHEE